MNTLDAIIIICMCYNLIIGLKKGAVKMIANIFGIITALYLSNIFSSQLNQIVFTLFPKLPETPYIQYSIYFFITIIFLFIMTEILHHLIKWSGIGLINHILGGGLGFLRGFVFCIIFVAPLTILKFNIVNSSLILTDLKPYIEQSHTYLKENNYFSHFFEPITKELKQE